MVPSPGHRGVTRHDRRHEIGQQDGETARGHNGTEDHGQAERGQEEHGEEEHGEGRAEAAAEGRPEGPAVQGSGEGERVQGDEGGRQSDVHERSFGIQDVQDLDRQGRAEDGDPDGDKTAPKTATAKKAAATTAPAKKAAAAKAPAKKAAATKARHGEGRSRRRLRPRRPRPRRPRPPKAITKAPAKTVARRVPAAKAPAKRAAAKAPAKRATKAPATKAPAAKAPATKAPAAKAPATKAPPASTLAVREDESPWTEAELQAVRDEMSAELARLEGELNTIQGSIDDVLRDSVDGSGDDQADSGAKAFEREQEMTLLANARSAMLQTRHALDRIDVGTYGICESCGNPIGKLRLQAFPRATLCVSWQRQGGAEHEPGLSHRTGRGRLSARWTRSTRRG